MAKSENFLLSDSKKSERGIADAPVEETPPQREPSVLEVLDALGMYFDNRLREIEAKIEAGCKCQEK